MASFFAASAMRRFGSGGGAGGFAAKGGALAAATAGFATFSWAWDPSASAVDCEAAPSSTSSTSESTTTSGKSNGKTLRKRMTLIGRFSLESETPTNPSIPTFFVALVGEKPFTAQTFAQLWKDRGMEDLHPRFHHVVSPTHQGYFEQRNQQEPLDIQDALPPMLYREDLKHRIQACLTHPLNVQDALWQVQISNGTLGSSGAIPGNKAVLLEQEFPYFKESILLFRGHHALADGVSLTAAFGDLCDQAQELRDAVHVEVQRRKGTSKSFMEKLKLYCKRLLWFFAGSIQATLHHLYLLLFTPRNPFLQLQPLLENDKNSGRTVSWCDAAPLKQVKQVAKSMGDKVTVNDVIVSCVTYAVARQLEQHRNKLVKGSTQAPSKKIQRQHDTINVVIPVHLGGGVLLPGQSVGNNIGAFCAQVPGEQMIGAEVRLERVHESLSKVKSTPAPLLSYMVARATSILPFASLKQRLFRMSQAHACVAVTNNRGSPQELSLNGQSIVSMAGFLPLPPGIPIGVSVTSYNGEVSLSVTAEPWAVPNSDQFLKWMLEEYQRLLKISRAETKQRKYL